MKNKDFRINDNIIVQGYRGKIINITNCIEYKISYNNEIIGNGLTVLTIENAEETIKKGYTLTPTGRTATYFQVKFNDDEDIKNTAYDSGTYGCIDDFECFGTY